MISLTGQYICYQKLNRMKDGFCFQVSLKSSTSLSSRKDKFQDRFVMKLFPRPESCLAVSLAGQSTNQKVIEERTEIIHSKRHLGWVFNISLSASYNGMAKLSSFILIPLLLLRLFSVLPLHFHKGDRGVGFTDPFQSHHQGDWEIKVPQDHPVT